MSRLLSVSKFDVVKTGVDGMKLKKWLEELYRPAGTIEDKRDYFIDNLKALLIVLVIFGHIVLYWGSVEQMTALYYFVHTFHMPFFVFVTGYMAKGVMKNGKFAAQRLFSMLWMYLVFSILSVLVARAFGRDARLNLFDVSAAQWYLLAVAIWYLLVPLLLSLKPWVGMLLTVAAGLLIGYFDNVDTYLTLSRVFTFMPFFAFGLYLSKEKMEAFLDKKLWVRGIALLVLVLACGYFVFVGNPLYGYSRIVFGGKPYREILKEYRAYGFLIRGGLYAFAVVISAACMLVMPRRKMFFSYVGKYSMAVYVLHILVRNGLNYAGVFDLTKQLSAPYMLLTIPVSVVAALLLGNPLFGKAFNFISNPIKFLKKKQD